jgi:hypothetical protein
VLPKTYPATPLRIAAVRLLGSLPAKAKTAVAAMIPMTAMTLKNPGLSRISLMLSFRLLATSQKTTHIIMRPAVARTDSHIIYSAGRDIGSPGVGVGIALLPSDFKVIHDKVCDASDNDGDQPLR